MGMMHDEEVCLRLEQTKPGYYCFVAIFTWPPGADEVARERFGLYFTDPDKLFKNTGMDPNHLQAYSLTGARTIVVTGLAPSSLALYLYCSVITQGTAIEAKVYDAVDTNLLKDLVVQPS